MSNRFYAMLISYQPLGLLAFLPYASCDKESRFPTKGTQKRYLPLIGETSLHTHAETRRGLDLIVLTATHAALDSDCSSITITNFGKLSGGTANTSCWELPERFTVLKS
jgi:hypothetical protein